MTTTHDERRRVWLITGAGRGLGRAFVVAALSAGDLVVATVRRRNVLNDLQAVHPGALRVLELDVRDRAAVRETIAAAIDCFGRLDVVVNNAGRGLVGAAEEVAEDEVREQFDTNVLGAIWVTQAVLPHFRARGGGHVVQVSTVGGVGSMPMLGMYNASKWALEGFSEALAAEVAGFGVRVTIAELGGFATDWAGSSMRFAAPVAAYDDLRESLFGTTVVPWPAAQPAGEEEAPRGHDAASATETVGATDGAVVEAAPTEPDPSVAARALLEHVDAAEGPLRLLVGDDAPVQVQTVFERRRDDYGRDPRFTWPA
jgi:NAD(P)-dependent dehydrogenase (short-subunit alcohol dehydrogenase family)